MGLSCSSNDGLRPILDCASQIDLAIGGDSDNILIPCVNEERDDDDDDDVAL